MDSVIDLTRAYAAHMDGWRAEPDSRVMSSLDECAVLINDTERVRLRVATQWRSDRLFITPEFPYQSGVSGPGADSISINPRRDPAAVAKDILRRAVPATIEGTRQWEANIAAYEAELADMARIRADLTEEFPSLTSWGGAGELQFAWSPGRPDDEEYRQGGTVKLYGGTLGATVELHGLTVEQVKRMLHAIELGD
jgi:hypothetical protein